MLNRKVLACIQCGAPLLELKCKLKCPRCGYFEDCLPEQPTPLCGTAPLCSDGGTSIAQETYSRSSSKKSQAVDSDKPFNLNRFPYTI